LELTFQVYCLNLMLKIMGKKGKKKRGRKKSPVLSQKMSAAQLLQRMKKDWEAGRRAEALSGYRTWLNKTGSRRDCRIEGEMLFREASSCFEEAKYERASALLDDALKKDPDNAALYSHYKAVCSAKMGDYQTSIEILKNLEDDFHCAVLSHLNQRCLSLSEHVSDLPVIERPELLGLWNTLTDSEENPAIPASSGHFTSGTASFSNTALKNIESAFEFFTSGSDPSRPLNLLKRKAGFGPLSAELLLLYSVRERDSIKIRSIIKVTPALSQSPQFHRIIKIHTVSLLKEKNYTEIATLYEILNKMQIKPPFMEKARDESFFNMGLKEIGENHFEKALDFFLDIGEPSPAVLHNTALCYQELQQYDKANEYWIKLLRIEKKPKRSDPEDKRAAYSTTLKYIAQNFLQEDMFDEACSYFKEALACTKNDAEALEALYMIAIEMEKYSESLHFSKRLFELEPDNEEYLLNYIQELHYNKYIDTLIPLYQKQIERYPDNKIFKEGLASCYLEKAWDIRNEAPGQAEKFVNKAKKLTRTHPKLLYLEGHFLRQKSKKNEASKKYEKAAQYSDSHMLDYQLGRAFYEDGIINTAVKLFKDITSCRCDESDLLFERAVHFLSDRNDYKNTMMLCDLSIKKKGYTLYDISAMLYDFHKPVWAKEYSSRLILQDDLDEDMMFLHLMILNSTGNKEETLAYALRFYQYFLENNDPEGAMASKEIIRQIKSRGRFKHQ